MLKVLNPLKGWKKSLLVLLYVTYGFLSVHFLLSWYKHGGESDYFPPDFHPLYFPLLFFKLCCLKVMWNEVISVFFMLTRSTGCLSHIIKFQPKILVTPSTSRWLIARSLRVVNLALDWSQVFILVKFARLSNICLSSKELCSTSPCLQTIETCPTIFVFYDQNTEALEII